MFSKILLKTVVFFIVTTALSQTDSGQKMHIKLIKMHNNIYMLQGNGGNIGLSFGNDGVLMIDSQYAEGIEQIQKEIKKKSDKPVRFLVNTHFHGDHTGANAEIAQSGTIIFSHENVRERLQKTIDESTKKIAAEMLPIITFSEDMSIHFNGEKIYVFHLPNAHTDGDAMVYFTESNVLHTGDVLFNGRYPFIDAENGGSVKGCIDGLRKVQKITNKNTKIIPGHGDAASYQDLEKTINMLETVYKRVRNYYVNKKTEDEVAKATDITKEYDAQNYGTGFINTEAFLRMVYKDVATAREAHRQNEADNKRALQKIEQMKKTYNEKNKE